MAKRIIVETMRLFIHTYFSSSPLCIFMDITTVVCKQCGDAFEKLTKEIKRSKALGRHNFCSRTCSTVYRNKHLPKEGWNKCYKIQRHAGNRRDELSPFRLYLNRGRASIRKHRNDLTAKYLKELWDKQRGICPYTGIKMFLPKTSSEWNVPSLKKASVDRIDPNKEYEKGNVEFVCLAINLAKNSFTRKEMKEFLLEIVVEPRGVEPLS